MNCPRRRVQHTTSRLTVQAMAGFGRECPICSEDYTDPKVLNCGHSFCCFCLQGWITSAPDPATCPECRMEIVLPVGGVQALPTNYTLMQLHNEADVGRNASPIYNHEDSFYRRPSEIDLARPTVIDILHSAGSPGCLLEDNTFMENGVVFVLDNNNDKLLSVTGGDLCCHYDLRGAGVGRITSVPGTTDMLLFSHNKRVKVYDPNTQVQERCIKTLRDPFAVAITSLDGNTAIAVAEKWKPEVFFFDLTDLSPIKVLRTKHGNIRYMAGQPGQETLVLNHNSKLLQAYRGDKQAWTWQPGSDHYFMGLCMTGTGSVFVADRINLQVLMLSAGGLLIGALLSAENGIQAPLGIGYSDRYHVMTVTDEAGTIHVYSCPIGGTNSENRSKICTLL